MALISKYKLSKEHASEYKKLRANKRLPGRYFVLNYYCSGYSSPKFSVILLKKFISKAADRNLIRRRVHSAIINYVKLEGLKSGVFVFVSLNTLNSKKISYEELSTDVNSLLSRVS